MWIKIKMAETDHESNETQTWRYLWTAANDPQQPALPSHTTSIMPPIWDEFTVDGPNGTHQCIVTVPARMTVAEAQDALYTRFFQLKVVRVIVAQLIKAVAFIHTRGYVHADLRLGNVLLKFLKSIAKISSDKLFDIFGSPLLEPVKITYWQQRGAAAACQYSLPHGSPSLARNRSEDIKLYEASTYNFSRL